MSKLSPVFPCWLWIILHLVQNVIWFWLLKWGGFEWVNNVVPRRDWDDETTDKKYVSWGVVILFNIIFIYGIIDPYIRWNPRGFMDIIMYFPGIILFLLIVGIYGYAFIKAYIEYWKQNKISQK